MEERWHDHPEEHLCRRLGNQQSWFDSVCKQEILLKMKDAEKLCDITNLLR